MPTLPIPEPTLVTHMADTCIIWTRPCQRAGHPIMSQAYCMIEALHQGLSTTADIAHRPHHPT